MDRSTTRFLLTAVLSLAATFASAQIEPFGPKFTVSTYTTSEQRTTPGKAVAQQADGSFVVVWRDASYFAAGYEVVGRRFDSSGMPLGTDSTVNTFTTSGQYEPAVAARPAGGFVVVWC